MSGSKTCIKCDQVKSLESFYRDRSHADGRMNVCRDCYKVQRKAYRARPEVKAREREYTQRPESKERARQYMRAYMRDYIQKPKVRAQRRAYMHEYYERTKESETE